MSLAEIRERDAGYESSDHPGCAVNEDRRELLRLYDQLSASNAALAGALAEAIEDISDWATYASEYFQDKHDLAGCLAKHRAVLASARQANKGEQT